MRKKAIAVGGEFVVRNLLKDGTEIYVKLC